MTPYQDLANLLMRPLDDNTDPLEVYPQPRAVLPEPSCEDHQNLFKALTRNYPENLSGDEVSRNALHDRVCWKSTLSSAMSGLGESPIHFAIREGYYLFLEHVLELYDDLLVVETNNQRNDTLMCAVLHGQTHVAELLIRKGANPNAQNQLGESPLLRAIERQDYELVVVLISGVDRDVWSTIAAEDTRYAYKILSSAVTSVSGGHCMKELKQRLKALSDDPAITLKHWFERARDSSAQAHGRYMSAFKILGAILNVFEPNF